MHRVERYLPQYPVYITYHHDFYVPVGSQFQSIILFPLGVNSNLSKVQKTPSHSHARSLCDMSLLQSLQAVHRAISVGQSPSLEIGGIRVNISRTRLARAEKQAAFDQQDLGTCLIEPLVGMFLLGFKLQQSRGKTSIFTGLEV